MFRRGLKRTERTDARARRLPGCSIDEDGTAHIAIDRAAAEEHVAS